MVSEEMGILGLDLQKALELSFLLVEFVLVAVFVRICVCVCPRLILFHFWVFQIYIFCFSVEGRTLIMADAVTGMDVHICISLIICRCSSARTIIG